MVSFVESANAQSPCHAAFCIGDLDGLVLGVVTEQKKPQVKKAETGNDLPEQLRIRREKRARLMESGIDPYPVVVDRTISLRDLREKFVVVAKGRTSKAKRALPICRPARRRTLRWPSPAA